MSPEMTSSQAPSTPARSTYGSNVARGSDTGTGATPRTTTTPQQQWVPSSSGYSTPPQSSSTNGGRQPPAHNLYQLVGSGNGEHAEANGTGASEAGYAGQPGLGGVAMASQTPPQSYGSLNGASTGSNKRMREVDDEDEHGSRPSSRGDGDDYGHKKRKIREGSSSATPMSTGGFDRNVNSGLARSRSTVRPGSVRR